MKLFSVKLFFLLLSNVVIGFQEKFWKTCEISEKDFICPDWCARLNRYEKIYSEFRGFNGTNWQGLLKYSILFIIPATIIIYIWWKIRQEIKIRREKLKKRIHRKKLKFMKRLESQKRDLKIKQNYAEAPDSVRERPVRHGIIYSMQMNPEFEHLYLTYRRKGFMEEMENTTATRYRYYDKLTLPANYTELEYFADDKCPEIKKLDNDPQFTDQSVALEWAIKTPHIKIAKPRSAAIKALLKEHNLL